MSLPEGLRAGAGEAANGDGDEDGTSGVKGVSLSLELLSLELLPPPKSPPNMMAMDGRGSCECCWAGSAME